MRIPTIADCEICNNFIRLAAVAIVHLGVQACCECPTSQPVPESILTDDNLEPESGAMAGFSEWTYEALLSNVFFDETGFRKCQMVFLPSFQIESTVHVYDPMDNSSSASRSNPSVIAKEAKNQLHECHTEVVDKAKCSASIHENRGIPEYRACEAKALEGVDRATIEWRRDIDYELLGILSQVWKEMLAGTHYEQDRQGGLDGEEIHVAHGELGYGIRSGKGSGMNPGSRVWEFMELGKALHQYAKKEIDRELLLHRARRLLDRIH